MFTPGEVTRHFIDQLCALLNHTLPMKVRGVMNLNCTSALQHSLDALIWGSVPQKLISTFSARLVLCYAWLVCRPCLLQLRQPAYTQRIPWKWNHQLRIAALRPANSQRLQPPPQKDQPHVNTSIWENLAGSICTRLTATSHLTVWMWHDMMQRCSVSCTRRRRVTRPLSCQHLS
jgi:hypothetical protein